MSPLSAMVTDSVDPAGVIEIIGDFPSAWISFSSGGANLVLGSRWKILSS